METEFTSIRYSGAEDGVARIVLARSEKRNAQDRHLLTELNRAFDMAAQDDDVKVIVLAGDPPDFSSGHSLGGGQAFDMDEYKPVSTWGGFSQPGAEGSWAAEEEFFYGFSERWRDIPKPTIAEVQGWVIAGGLMLMWPCDLVIAAENTKFTDPVVAWGVNGVEYFGHPWELGVRAAKEFLFTGQVLPAEEAKRLGMINHVVPLDELTSFTMTMAKKIARRPSMGLKLAKQSVNQAQDAMGFKNALRAAMSLQQLGHSHNRIKFGFGVDPSGKELIDEDLGKYK